MPFDSPNLTGTLREYFAKLFRKMSELHSLGYWVFSVTITSVIGLWEPQWASIFGRWYIAGTFFLVGAYVWTSYQTYKETVTEYNSAINATQQLTPELDAGLLIDGGFDKSAAAAVVCFPPLPQRDSYKQDQIRRLVTKYEQSEKKDAETRHPLFGSSLGSGYLRSQESYQQDIVTFLSEYESYLIDLRSYALGRFSTIELRPEILNIGNITARSVTLEYSLPAPLKWATDYQRDAYNDKGGNYIPEKPRDPITIDHMIGSLNPGFDPSYSGWDSVSISFPSSDDARGPEFFLRGNRQIARYSIPSLGANMGVSNLPPLYVVADTTQHGDAFEITTAISADGLRSPIEGRVALNLTHIGIDESTAASIHPLIEIWSAEDKEL